MLIRFLVLRATKKSNSQTGDRMGWLVPSQVATLSRKIIHWKKKAKTKENAQHPTSTVFLTILT